MLDVTSCFSFTFALHEHCIPLFVCSFSVLFYLICIGTDFRNVMVSNNWWFAKTIFPSAGTENELTYNARTCTKFPAKKKRGNEKIFTVNEMPWSGIDTGPLYLSRPLCMPFPSLTPSSSCSASFYLFSLAFVFFSFFVSVAVAVAVSDILIHI